MGLKTFGLMAVDWEERVNIERLRQERLARAKSAVEKSELGSLLCFDMNNIRYITATHIGTWAMDKLVRFSLLPQDDEPILWDFGSAARHHQIYCPWLGERSRAGISTLRGATNPSSGLAEDVAKKIKHELEKRNLQNEPVGVDVIVHPEARAILEGYYESRGGLTEARLRMARVPEGASLIPNRYTGAPGIRFDNVFIMAGVPSITAGMLDALSGTLEGGAPLLSETIGCWVQESEVATLLGDTEKAYPGCQIGSYPFWHEGRTGANFVIRSTGAEQLAACTRALVAALEAMGKPAVAGGI